MQFDYRAAGLTVAGGRRSAMRAGDGVDDGET
jgi:hypothetical protein